jgi:hypothetical protein
MMVLVAVRDFGARSGSKSLDRLFDAFYPTKPKGMGMGLAISRSDHRSSWRTALGDGECVPRRAVSIRGADSRVP